MDRNDAHPRPDDPRSLKEMRQIKPDVEVVLTRGDNDRAPWAASRARAWPAPLLKPLDHRALLAEVSKVLEG